MYTLTIGFTDRPSKHYLYPVFHDLYSTARIILYNEDKAQFAFIVDANKNVRIHIESKQTPNGAQLTELKYLTTD